MQRITIPCVYITLASRWLFYYSFQFSRRVFLFLLVLCKTLATLLFFFFFCPLLSSVRLIRPNAGIYISIVRQHVYRFRPQTSNTGGWCFPLLIYSKYVYVRIWKEMIRRGGGWGARRMKLLNMSLISDQGRLRFYTHIDVRSRPSSYQFTCQKACARQHRKAFFVVVIFHWYSLDDFVERERRAETYFFPWSNLFFFSPCYFYISRTSRERLVTNFLFFF